MLNALKALILLLWVVIFGSQFVVLYAIGAKSSRTLCYRANVPAKTMPDCGSAGFVERWVDRAMKASNEGGV